MTDTATAATTTQLITPYITVHDGAEALGWYADALGATETMRYTGDDGRVGHFSLQLTGTGLGPFEFNSEAELYQKIPDIDIGRDVGDPHWALGWLIRRSRILIFRQDLLGEPRHALMAIPDAAGLLLGEHFVPPGAIAQESDRRAVLRHGW